MKNITELASVCVAGPCPTVFEVGPAGIRDVDVATIGFFHDQQGNLIIVGAILSPEELRLVAHKVKKGEETAVRVPKSLIARLTF